MSTIEEIVANVADRLKYARTAPQTAEDYWMLFTPNIKTHHDIITTSAAVKKEFPRHPTLFHLSSWAQDIVITYIVFEMLA